MRTLKIIIRTWVQSQSVARIKACILTPCCISNYCSSSPFKIEQIPTFVTVQNKRNQITRTSWSWHAVTEFFFQRKHHFQMSKRKLLLCRKETGRSCFCVSVWQQKAFWLAPCKTVLSTLPQSDFALVYSFFTNCIIMEA